MFWRIPNFSASSPVESILDKEGFTLEELLDEEEIIQECKALNTRLLNFLRDGAQVEQLLRYIVEEAPVDAGNKRAFKFPFIACEIFTCEIDVILKTLVEDEELMDILFSFLEPNHTHSSLLAGYFSKVVVCLMLRKTSSLMNYVQTHESIFHQLIDLIGITSITEILVRLVGADDHMYPNFMDVMQWLADNNLLEMIVDKLSPSSSLEVHANVAEVLWAIIRNAPSPLAAKLSSASFVSRMFSQALDDSTSKSALVHILSVCISLLEPKRSASTTLIHSMRKHLYEPSISVGSETISAMLPKLDELLRYLNVSSDINILPTTYGELRPPLGKHRLKIVEFVAVLLGTGDVTAEKKLIDSVAIQKILNLFFQYPFNNFLHHHVESILMSCLDSKNVAIVDHLFCDCNLIGKLLQADKNPILCSESSLTLPAAGRQSSRLGYIGHITRIANKLVQLGNCNDQIRMYLQENTEWTDWQNKVLHDRNAVENVYRWVCGRPTALQDRIRDSDEEELHDRDSDAPAVTNNTDQPFDFRVYENDDVDEDAYFDDEHAEVVMSSLRLGDGHESGTSLFTNSNWFAFQEDRNTKELTSFVNRMEDVNLNGTGSSSDERDEVVVGEDEELSTTTIPEGLDDTGVFRFEAAGNDELFNDQQLPDWVGWREIRVDGPTSASEPIASNPIPHPNGALANGNLDPSLFEEEEAELVGVDMDKAAAVSPLKLHNQPGSFCEKKRLWVESELGVVQE